MIDVMKRLAELDAKNSNVISEATGAVSCSSCGEKFKIAGRKDGFSHCKDHAGKTPLAESVDLEECGPMGMMGGMNQSHTPASVNITAGSGQELSAMLKDIMSLAGIHKVEPSHLGVEQQPMTLTAEPVMSVGVEPSAGDKMRSVLDKLNPDTTSDKMSMDDEETDESVYNNTPADPNEKTAFNAQNFSNHENQPGAGDTSSGKSRVRNLPTATYESLMDEYKTFVAESTREIGQMMADDGITYSREKENEIIDLMAEYMKKAGMSSKSINRLINYDQDYIPDQLSYLPRVKSQGMSSVEQQIRDRLEELEDEMEPEYAYEKVAHEFGMSQQELQHKLAHGFDTDGGSMMEVSGSVDFDKVLDAIAALYGDDMWDNDSMQDLANDLEQENPTDQELDFIIANGKLPKRLANMQFSSGDDIKFGGQGMMENMDRISEDLQADDGEYYKNSDEFFSKFDADTFDKEVTSPDGMEVKGYVDGKCVMAWRFKSAKKIGGYGIFDDSALGMDNDMMEGGVSKFHVFYKDNAKRGSVVKTEVKASSPEEAESAFREWNSTNTPGRFSFVSARPVSAGMMEGKPSAGHKSRVSEISNSLNRAVHMKRHDNALAANMDMVNSRAGIAAIPYDKAVKQHDIEKAKYKKNIELNKIRNANQATARRDADHERIATGTNEVKK